jgi:hypothetical protein
MQTLKSFLDHRLVRQARLFEAMTERLRIHLPAEVAPHCWVGGVRDRILIVVSDSASFSMLVHYQQHEILKQVNSDFSLELPAPLTKLKTKIAKLPAAVKRPLVRPRLSADDARRLTSVAANITDPELKSALIRLAQRGSKAPDR